MAGKVKNITTKCVLTQTGLTDNTYPVNGVPGVSLAAFTQTFTAETNFLFNVPPSIDFSNVDDPNDYSVTITDTKVNDVVTVRVFSIVYTTDLLQPSHDEIIFVANAESGYNPSSGNIYSYELDTSYLKNTGDNRSITMLGDPGSIITVSIFNTTPGFPPIDMYTRQYTFQEDGTSLSYIDAITSDVLIVSSVDFNIPGLKYWRVPITNEVITISFTVSGSNTILWDSEPVVNGSSNPVYLYQYKTNDIILQLSQGDTANINSNNGFFGLGPVGGNYINSLKDIWFFQDNVLTPWAVFNGYSRSQGNSNGPFAASPSATYVSIFNTSNSNAGKIASVTLGTGSSILSENLVVGRTYKLTFEVRIGTSVGTSGILFRHVTSNSTYSGVNGSSPTGLFGEAYSGSDGWRVVNMTFTAGTPSTDKIEILTATPGTISGNLIDLSKFRLIPLYATGTTTTNENLCSNISILKSGQPGSYSGGDDNQDFDFKLKVFLATANNPRKTINYIPSALTPVPSSIPVSLIGDPVNTSTLRGFESILVDIIKSSDYNGYRKNYKYTNGAQVQIDNLGSLKGGYNTMHFENGMIATLSNTQVKVTNAQLNQLGTVWSNSSLEFSGTLNIVKNPVGGDSVIEFNLAGWFTQGANTTTI